MAPACVLDASAAVRLIVGDPAAAKLAELIREAPLVLAPELMLTEDRRLRQLAERVLP